MGYVEPISEEDAREQAAATGQPAEKVQFENEVVGNAIPPAFLPACEKGFREACNSGHLTGHPVEVHCCPALCLANPLSSSTLYS